MGDLFRAPVRPCRFNIFQAFKRNKASKIVNGCGLLSCVLFYFFGVLASWRLGVNLYLSDVRDESKEP